MGHHGLTTHDVFFMYRIFYTHLCVDSALKSRIADGGPDQDFSSLILLGLFYMYHGGLPIVCLFHVLYVLDVAHVYTLFLHEVYTPSVMHALYGQPINLVNCCDYKDADSTGVHSTL